MWSWTVPYRVRPAAAGVALCALALVSSADHVVRMGSPQPIRTTWFLALALALLSGLPLYGAFGGLEDTFSRAVTVRCYRAATTAVLTLVGCAALVLASAPGSLTSWFFSMQAVAVVAVVLVDDLAWLPSVAVGSSSIFYDHSSVGRPVEQVLEATGPWVPVVLFGCSVVAFVVLGSGRARSVGHEATG